MGIAAGIQFYHTQNINHLDQNIGLNKHKRNLLVSDNDMECNDSQEKNKLLYQDSIHGGAGGMNSRFVGNRFLKQAK